MFKKIITLAKESLIYGLSTVVARFFNFLLVPFYSYFLAAGEYGVVATLYSYIALLNIIYQYGMDQAYLRFASNKKSKDKDVFSTPFWAILATSVLLSLIIVSNGSKLTEIFKLGSENSRLIFYGVSIITIDSLSIVPFAKLRLNHRAWAFAGIKSAWVFANVISNIILVGFLKMGVRGVFISALTASSFSLVLLLPVILKSIRPAFRKDLFLEMFKFAWPFVPAGFGASVVQVIDKPILMFLAGSAVVGVYQANYKFGIFMLLVVAMFDQAWRPFFLEHSKHENARDIFAKVFTYFAVCGVWIIFAVSFFIGDAIRFSFSGYHLLHPDYWGGIGIIPIILTAYLFYGFYIIFMAAPILSKKTQILAKVTLIGAGINIIANLVLIRFFAMFGAAWASLVSYFCMASALFVFSNKFYSVNYEWKRIVHLALITLFTIILYLSGRSFAAESFKLFLAVKVVILIIFPILLFATRFFTERELNSVKRRILKWG